jgi:hypothetical protein
MFSCDQLSHPFLNDPGTAQSQRLLPGQLPAEMPIDGRQTSDLLNYIAGFSPQVTFYDQNLNKSDWQPFFTGLAFSMSQMADYDVDGVNTGLASCTKLFTDNPSAEGLQLIFFYIWYSAIYPIEQWSNLLQNTGLDLEQTLQTLIKDRLPSSVKSFISWMNTAVKCFCIQPMDPSPLLQNSAWGLTAADLTAYDQTFSCTTRSRRSQMLALQSSISGIATDFIDVISLVTSGASDQVNDNLVALLQSGGQANTPPHLAVLYSFLTQFQNVQGDLNNLTGDHLNYFYQNVLQLAPAAIVPDNAYVVFGLQQQTPNYTLPAGTQIKDGKDNNQADIIFSLDSPIEITQAQTTQLSTLFVNTLPTGVATTTTPSSYVEGVYMAPNALMADGVSQAFTGPGPNSWPTLGAQLSEYTPTGATTPVPYPSARLGFLLTSKVLLMNEGLRHVYIQLSCQWGTVCTGDPTATAFFNLVSGAFSQKYLVVTQALINQAAAMGLSSSSVTAVKEYFLKDTCQPLLCSQDQTQYLDQAIVAIPVCQTLQEWTKDATLGERHWTAQRVESCNAEFRQQLIEQIDGIRASPALTAVEKNILLQLLKPQSVFNVTFSGAKAWLTPDFVAMTMSPLSTDKFLLRIYARIGPTQPAVTFYSPSLGENFNTTDPLVCIQLNDTLKMDIDDVLAAFNPKGAPSPTPAPPVSCLVQPVSTCGGEVSFYEFFRNVILLPGKNELDSTKIHITVCDVKNNLVAQNDNNVLNIKSAFTPFGATPVITDFDVWPVIKPHPGENLIGPSFYVGSAEIFLKKWTQLNLNINWYLKPSSFTDYYAAYLYTAGTIFPPFPLPHHPYHPPADLLKDLDNPGYQVALSLLHNGSWVLEADHRPHLSNYGYPHDKAGALTHQNTRHLFAMEQKDTFCGDARAYEYSFEITPEDFHLEDQLSYDPVFAPLPVVKSANNGYIKLTLEYQDFLCNIYPSVMSRQNAAIAKAKNDDYIPSPVAPWTPTITNMSIDYQAEADIGDINLIQLYPYQGTYMAMDISAHPPLFATFCAEGYLFIGLSGLVPGDSLNVLFQLAEATGATEAGPITLTWEYLANNQWVALRPGFEIVQDDTNNLLTTGIIQFSFPDDISSNNSILPSGSSWIRVSAPGNTTAASQAIAVTTQAALATFLNNPTLNDQNRPGNIPLPNGSLTKLVVPIPAVTQINQPIPSFGGQAPEASANAYTQRVSEQLRHKGRALQKWDYERMVLQQFPQVLVAKCINHSYALSSQNYKWDFPMAPGNIIVAVLPDTTQLTVANALQPTVPMSMLTSIQSSLSAAASTFVQLTVMNPRYEPVDICLTATLASGMNTQFYTVQLQQDIQGFMAPWLSGNTAALQFAQRLYRSDLVEFIESLTYIGNVISLNMCHQGDTMPTTPPDFIDPLTPRSILTAGRVVPGISSATTTGNLWKKRIKTIG